MVSSLAAQLAKGISLNAPLLADRSRRKHAESYLFTSREADQHDYHSIHALGVNGLSKLKTLNAKFGKYDGNLFSDAARDIDRTLQSEGQNVELDGILASFLRDLGPYLLESPTSKALEWIIRRFRVNEFNVDSVMAAFLPYHETAQFAKMVSILHVKESNLWSFLSPLKAAAKSLPRSMLVEEMVVNQDLARFIVALLPEALESTRTYRTLTGFTASVTMDYLSRMKKVDEETVAFILPALVRTFETDSNQDCALAGYATLAALSQRCRLSPRGLMAVISEMIKGQQHVNSQHILPFFVAVVAPQDQLEEFSDITTDSIVNLPGFITSLTDCFSYVGVEKLVLPLLPSLVRRVNDNVLNSLLTSPSITNIVVEHMTQLLLDHILASKETSEPTPLQLLTVIFQRHGTVFSEISLKVQAAVGDGDDRQTFEQILHSVVLPSSSSGDREKWILSNNSTDIASRVTAVREMIKALPIDETDSESRADVYDALRSRVADTNATVIEALYNDPKVVLPIFSNLQFVEAVSSALAAPDVSRSVMRLHFAFIAGDFSHANPDLAHDIFEHIFLPHLLFTKPRQKTATLVWQLLSDSEFTQYELLRGCTEILQAHQIADSASRSTEEMTALDLALASCIAGNVVSSNVYPRHLNMLLRLSSQSDSHTAIVCYLILRSVLSHLSGEHQVDAAQRVLSSLGIQSLDVLQGVMAKATTLKDLISDDILLKGIILKPNSPGTLCRLQVALLALLPVVQQPVDVIIDWFGDGPVMCFLLADVASLSELLSHQDSADMRGKHFVDLARAIYTLANSSSTTHALSTSLLKALFLNLRGQALLFLAGVWTSSILSDMDSVILPHAALFHGAAFLRAQVADGDHPHDFQGVVPSLLIALQSRQHIVRSAAMDCVAIISESSSSAKGSPTIYALDSVYGNSSSGLQYLEWADFGHFVSSLNGRREHFLNDGEYLGVFFQEMLCRSRSSSKKESGFKQRVLCYILSHAIVWNSLRARVALLEMLRNVPHRAKLYMLLPLLQSFVSGNQKRIWNKENNALDVAHLQLLLEAFDRTVVPVLNEPGSGSWSTLIRLVRFIFTNGKMPVSLHKTILHQLCSGLFEALAMDLKREICIVLIESATVSPDTHAAIKKAMSSLLKDAALIASLLLHFQPAGKDGSQRAPKRPKLTSESEEEFTLRPMIVLVEILVAHPMPDSVELMSSALDVLSRVFHNHASQSDANYLMQLLMSMLESIALSTSEPNTMAPGSVRMEVLVEILRVSDNPQIFNQTLLLIANLARLAPEFVMQNVMPVFTFMGSNVFHRDDSYSFRVVQKTIDSIVPVVIASFEAKHPGPLELQIASRDFLRVFTDAATHVPRHRRTQFFNHLVGALGRDEFAVSICLLLVDKVVNKVVRKRPGEIANAFGLPLTVLQANSKTVSFKSIERLLRENTRILHRLSDPEKSQETFLESPQDGDQSTPSILMKRQMEAILLFVDFALQKCSRKTSASHEAVIQEAVRLLLELTDLDQESTPSAEFSDVSRAAMKALGHLLRVISASEFAASISTILASNNPTIEKGAMNLLASRLTNITPATRQDISPTIIDILEYIHNKLKAPHDVSNFRAILNTLRAIAETADSREIPILTKVLPLVMKVAVNQNDHTADVLQCILPMSTKIGPRILPFFHDVVSLCNSALRDQMDPDDGASQIEQNAQAVLIALLSSISQFWNIDELVRLGELSLGTRPVFLTLRKTVAKRIPAKQLLPALFRVWSELATTPATDASSSWSSREAFFDLFRRVVRHASRDDIHNHLRDIFKLFLDAFDVCGLLNRQEVQRFETLTSTTFVDVVTKLNDAAFKPIYRRFFDWAFNDVTENLADRQITFSRILMALIKLLKGLVTPYMGLALVPLTSILESYSSNGKQHETLWISVVDLIQTSLTEDEGGFWREEKLRKLVPTLIAQVAICPSLLGAGDTKQALRACLGAMVSVMEGDSSLKKLNLELLMQTRSDDPQTRLFALQCSEHLWDRHGDKLVGFVSDVATFIAECAEDEHDEVAKAARALRRTIEKRCGSLDALMQ